MQSRSQGELLSRPRRAKRNATPAKSNPVDLLVENFLAKKEKATGHIVEVPTNGVTLGGSHERQNLADNIRRALSRQGVSVTSVTVHDNVVRIALPHTS